MLRTRIALLSLPLTLALGQASPASEISPLVSLTPHTQVATLNSPCKNPSVPAQATKTSFQYPPIAVLERSEGIAEVGVELSASGHLVSAWPIQSSGDRNLDRAAMETARTGHYSPERSNCAAIGGKYLMEVDFSL